MTAPKEKAAKEELEAILTFLKEPFPAEAIRWRPGQSNKDRGTALALAYVDARDVMDRLDLAVGAGAWQSRLERHDGIFICHLGIRLPLGPDGAFQWVWKSDAAGETDIEGAKGGASDALKRAAVSWGINRCAYSLPTPWVLASFRQNGKCSGFPKASLIVLQAIYCKELGLETPKGLEQDLREVAEGDVDEVGQSLAPASSPYITEAQRKQLYGANFQALEYVGFDKATVEGLSAAEKFAPINYATAHVGCSKVEQILVGNFDAAKAAMRTWCKENKDIAADQPDPDPSNGGEWGGSEDPGGYPDDGSEGAF